MVFHMEGEPEPKQCISSLTIAVGVDLRSLNLSLAVIPIKLSHLSNSAGEQGVTGKAQARLGIMAVRMIASVWRGVAKEH